MTRTDISHTPRHVGETVLLKGWVANHRAMGKITFIDVRDATGTVQCVIDDGGKELTLESVVSITGTVKQRPEKQVNSETLTGSVEIEVTSYELLNKAAPLPIPVRGDGYDINEEARLRYRYLDLRRERLANVIRLRAKFTKAVRDVFEELDFVEVETPLLTASTKEGARDFVVPSRLHPGTFYALPQSPQQYKQLLMSAGIENYFQLARCIRDEDLRADRGFEHTQIDVETSFRSQEDIHRIIEKVLSSAITKVGGQLQSEKFPVLTYEEVMDTYGDDKFDIRTEEEKERGVLAFAWVTRYPMFKKVDAEDIAEVRDGKSGWTFTHNPFSGIREEHKEWHRKGENIEKIEATQYDLVCNGYEIGSGSIRNHDPELLKATFRIMGYTDEEIESTIGHMIEAFSLGTPPHGGIALGLERLVMIISQEKSLKETVAFPMTYSGKTAVMEGPGEISDAQRTELGLNRGSSSPTTRVHDFLRSQNVSFYCETHEPTPTSSIGAEVRGTDIRSAAKALIFKGKKSGDNYMFVIPGDRKADTKAIKQVIGEEVEFEKPEVIQEKYNLTIGGIPPLGMVFGIRTYVDTEVGTTEEVVFNAGTQTESVRMQASDFVALFTPESIGEFSKI